MMKNIILLILVLFIQISCKEDTLIQQTEGLATLSIESVKNLVPLNLYHESLLLVFKNSEEVEKILEIRKINEELMEKTIEGNKYFSENIQIDLREAERTDYYISVLITANYTSPEEYLSFVDCTLFTTANNGYIPSLAIAPDRQPIICLLENELELLNKSFTNVYTNFVIEGISKFSQIYYTTDQGIVAFKDETNTLWVLDRME